jgi:RNA polymerase sigma factor (sigma-70 family)
MKSLTSQFKSVYDLNYIKVIRLCLGYTNGNMSLSKDLAQETFIKVWQNLDSFRNESSISTWIYRITVNTCLIELRKKKDVRLSNHLNHLEMSSPDFFDDKEVQLKKLYQCIRKLKTENKSIILLELEGLPQKEIAEVMGLSHDVIRVRIHRIKNELTKCVKK